MGTGKSKSVKQDLKEVRSRLSVEGSSVVITGRYHLLPRRLQDDYDMSETELGSGYNGSVYLATNKSTGEKCAVKPFKLRGVNMRQRREIKSEAEVFLGMDHPHVARLSDVYQDETDLFFVMENLEGGELFDRIQKFKRFTDIDAASTVWQMLLVVNYLHGRNIIHRDLKPENFLYDKKGSDHMKLIDFGFSRAHKQDTSKLRLVCGTTPYMAPEVIQGSYDKRGDLWSIGVITYILLVGKWPFEAASDQELKAKICQGVFDWPQQDAQPEQQAGKSQGAHDFVTKLLELDPEKRFSADEALKHPWLETRERAASKENDQHLNSDMLTSFSKFSEASKFRRNMLNMCAWSLTNEQRAKMREAFIAIDTDHTGTISLAELKEALEKNGLISVAKSEELVSSLRMEQIDYSDFLAAMLTSRISAHESTIRNAFRRFDTDSSGGIAPSELREVLGRSHKSSEVDTLVRSMDSNGDGVISFDEFLQYLRTDEADATHQAAAANIIEDEIKRSPTARQVEASLQGLPTTPEEPQKPAANSAVNMSSSEKEKNKRSSVCAIL